MSGSAIRDWRKVLRLTWPEIAALMTEQSASGVQLRRATPESSYPTPTSRA